MVKRWIHIAKIAAVYVGTVIGAGFASGQEILRFFNIYGVGGLLGLGVSMMLFVWFGTAMMLLGHQIQAFSYQDLNNFLLGRKVGGFVNGLVLIMLFGVSSAMLSGTGSLFAEQLHLPYQLGVWLTLGLCFVILQKGIQGVFSVNSVIVPLMILFCFIVGMKTMSQLPSHAPFDLNSLNQALFGQPIYGQSYIAQYFDRYGWLVSSFSYVALNLAMAQAVLVPIGRETSDPSLLRWGGLWGGIALGFMLLGNFAALQLKMPEILKFDIPMAEVIKGHGHWLYVFFLFVIYGEIFTTFVGNVFGLSRQLSSMTALKFNWILLLILGLAYIISHIGFSFLVSYLYPLLGYVSIVILLTLAVKFLVMKWNHQYFD